MLWTEEEAIVTGKIGHEGQYWWDLEGDWFLEFVSVAFGIEKGLLFIHVSENLVIPDFLSDTLWGNVRCMKFEAWVATR